MTTARLRKLQETTGEKENLVAATKMDAHSIAEMVERLRELEELAIDDSGYAYWKSNGERVGS